MRGKDGASYYGDWNDGSKQGLGVYKWASGEVYEGCFAKCTKHGQGW